MIPMLSAVFRRSRTDPLPSRDGECIRIRNLDETNSLEENTEPEQVFKKKSSGGLLLLRKRSAGDQEFVSRARAQSMSTAFEMSDVRDSELVKMQEARTVSTSGPKFAVPMSVKQATQAFANKQAERVMSSKVDPLWTERERKENQRKYDIDKRQVALDSSLSPKSPLMMKSVLTTGSENVVTQSLERPTDFSKPRNWKQQEIARAEMIQKSLSKLDMQPNPVGIEIVLESPGTYSVAPTEDETPTPKESRRFFNLPSMC